MKNKRRDSKAEFVNYANHIYIETLGFLSRLSNRYQRLIARDIIELASKVLDNCEEAQAIFPKDEIRKELRYKHLLEARAALMALDVHMSHVYELMMKNPQDCFMDSSRTFYAIFGFSCKKLEEYRRRDNELCMQEAF